MDEEQHKGGAKELLHTIISHPALLVTVLLAAAVAVYLLVKNGPQSSTTATTTGSASSTAGPADFSSYQQGYDTGYQRGSYTTPALAPPASTTPIPTTPTTTTTVTMPIPTTTIPVNNPQVSPMAAYTDQAGQPTTTTPYLGLLGPNAKVDIAGRTYKESGKSIALPSYVGKLSQGADNRVWYIDTNTGAQNLLTSGYGPGVTNSGFKPNSPQNTPPKKN